MNLDRVAQGITIRTALLAGFGCMLGLWLFAGYQVDLRMQQAQRDAEAVNARYLQAQELLASVRTQVLVASVLVRDAVLDPSGGTIGPHQTEIQRAYDSLDLQLERYVPFAGSASERERVARLRDEIRQLRVASDEVLSTDSSGWPSNAGKLLRRFMPRREAAIRMSEEVQALNRAAFVERQRTLNSMQASLQRQVWTVFGVALAISLVIGWLAYHHSTRLECRLTEQRAKEEQTALDLQRLSARLLHAKEEEQRRIARELHDEVGQALTAARVELAVARRTLDRMGAAPDLLADAESTADAALRSVRDLSRLLHPSALDDLGLVAALESQVSDFRRRYEIAIDFVHRGVHVRQNAEVERAVYRVVQEALTNIARHAHARSGRVVLHIDASVCRVVIEDDGVGFDVDDAERPGRRRGLGLLGIRERVAPLRGTVTIRSGTTNGTRIEMTVPTLDAAPAPQEALAVEPGLLTANPEVGHG